MLQNLLKNWKTTSIGIITIAGSIVHLAKSVHGDVDSEGVWMTCITGVVTGFGLLFAGDASASAQSHADSTAAINDLQFQVAATATAVKTGDTSVITKANVPVIADATLTPLISKLTEPTETQKEKQ
jgi:hypothetical protein